MTTTAWTLEEARLRAAFKAPYFAEVLFSMRMVPVDSDKFKTPGGGKFSMGVDKYWNCYYDPNEIATWDITQGAFVLIHEAWHCWANHAGRGKAWYGDKKELHGVFNVGADISLNPGVKELGLEPPYGKDEKGNYRCCFPENFKSKDGKVFPPNLTAEEYSELLMDSDHVQKVEVGFGGSAGDGELREWEGAGEQAGLEQVIREVIARKVAEDISKHQGNVPGSLKAQAQAMLAPPVVRWQDELAAQARCAVEYVRGHKDYTYMRPKKRSGVIFPGPRSPLPTIALVLDSSGSMCDKNTQGRLLGETQHVLRAYGKATDVYVGDTEIAWSKKVSNVNQVEWVGCGGTDMASIINNVVRRKRYDIIVLITDGYTPWPAPLRSKLIAVITPGGQASAPGWVKQIKMKETP